MKFFSILLIVLLFCSCASIRLDETYKLEIKSDKKSKVQYRDSTFNLPAEIEVYRSGKPIKLIFFTDSIKKEYNIKPLLHPNFIYGNIISPSCYLIDMYNPKRFYYGKTIILNSKDSIKVIRESLFKSPILYGKDILNQLTKEYPTKKGKVDFTISIPIATNFEMRPLNEGIKKSVGFGISIGADYYYKKNKFLSLTLSALADKLKLTSYYDQPPYDNHRIFSQNISLTDNFKINRFSLGYGLNFSENGWQYVKSKELETFFETKYIKKYNYNLGFAFNGYYQVFKCFYVGLNYKPTIFQVYPTKKLLYQHVLGIDCQFRF
jgi:hypothetical protein